MASMKTEIPKHELQALARAFADDIVAFFESEEGQREYEEWLQQKGYSVKNKAGSGALPALTLANVSVDLTVEIRIIVEKDKSEPVSNREKVRIIFAWCR